MHVAAGMCGGLGGHHRPIEILITGQPADTLGTFNRVHHCLALHR